MNYRGRQISTHTITHRDQVAQLQVTGKRRSLTGNTLHETPITEEH